MNLRPALLVLPFLASVILVGCGSPAPAPSGPTTTPASSAAPPSATPAESSAKKSAEALEALTADEAKTGKCSPEQESELGRLLNDVETAMKAKKDEDGKPVTLTLVSKKVLALGSSARGVELSVTGKGTELHVMAFGAKEISMDVLAGTTAATTMRSPYARDIPNLALDLKGAIGRVTEIKSDSRQVAIKQGQPIQVKMTGQGCAGMIAFMKGS